ncbi:hypothetical protein D9615_003094 [Tricholomella constricta]|uniref:Uncharacterized protein n=1 Tax=Tricholomella constricta TaxID=117010 RepID=A0A8H5HJS8_9AGAR|nr:hypothetical protein D9615_003094 [Tricholomella constricta]
MVLAVSCTRSIYDATKVIKYCEQSHKYLYSTSVSWSCEISAPFARKLLGGWDLDKVFEILAVRGKLVRAPGVIGFSASIRTFDFGPELLTSESFIKENDYRSRHSPQFRQRNPRRCPAGHRSSLLIPAKHSSSPPSLTLPELLDESETVCRVGRLSFEALSPISADYAESPIS